MILGVRREGGGRKGMGGMGGMGGWVNGKRQHVGEVSKSNRVRTRG